MQRSRSCQTIVGSPPPTTPRCRRQRWPLRALAISSQAHRVITGSRLRRPGSRLELLPPGPWIFFEACRRKRNVIDYDHASVATHTEAEEIFAEANDFFELVEHWIVANHPKLNP